MRKILSLVLAVTLISSVSFAQKPLPNDGSLKSVKSTALPFASVKANETMVLTYSDDVIDGELGTGGTFTTNAFAYFPAADFSANIGEYVYKISVGVGAAASISNFSVCIWTDTTSHGANAAYEQVVTTLVDGWNEVILTSPYVLGSDNIFIGYRMTTDGYSIGTDAAADATGYGDMLQDPGSGGITALGGLGFGDVCIKGHVGTMDGIEAELLSINTLPSLNAGMIDITGTIRNNGTDAITTYDVTYTIDGGAASAVYAVTGANIALGSTADFTHDVPADLTVAGTYTIEVTISNVNGGTDSDPTNNVLSKDITTVDNFIQKKVLHEVFTSSTCAPCASANPVIDGVVYQTNEDKSTLIKYQVSWPAPGDPYMNQESADKVTQYAVTAVPAFWVDGTTEESGVGYTLAKLDAFAANSAIATVTGSATYTGTSVNVDVDFEAFGAIAGNLVAQIAVIEVQTVNNTGNNGETSFNNVMMKFIPGTAGNALANFANGDVQNVTGNVDMTGTNVEEIGDLRVVAWLQDFTTHEVWQSEYITITSTELDGGVTAITSPVAPATCGDLAMEDVTVTINNTGFGDISNFTVAYTLNGGAPVEETYAGTIAVGASASYTFTAQVDLSSPIAHDIVAYTVITGDNSAGNDSYEMTISNGAIPIEIIITTDNYGGETSWILDDENGNTVASGDGYGDATTYSSTFCAGPSECYVFTIYDAYGDGMCCAYGAGSYEIIVDGVSFATGGEFAAEEVVGGICTENIEKVTANTFNIYPNPTSGLVNIVGAEGAQVIIYNMIGEVVYSESEVSTTATIDLSSYNAGNYIVKVIYNNEVATQKIVLTK